MLFWSNPDKNEVMINSLVYLLKFGHMITSTILLKSGYKIFVVDAMYRKKSQTNYKKCIKMKFLSVIFDITIFDIFVNFL